MATITGSAGLKTRILADLQYNSDRKDFTTTLRNFMTDVANYLTGEASDNTTTGATPTLNNSVGKSTTAALSTAALTEATVLTISNTLLTTGSIVTAVISSYTGAGMPVISKVEPTDDTLTIKIFNAHASNALDAAMVIDWSVKS